MDARAILAGLRQGRPPDAEEAAWFGRGIGAGEITDSQAGAFAMGVCRAPLSVEARVALTLAMRDSGTVLDWDLPGPVLDKHSTGGVGDCVSLPLAPALAACGAYVPMISGRGLGHTGGTLDKLEAIPGYRAEVDLEELRKITADVGCAIVSASANIAPADKRLYLIRDVTGTVESIDLITASILSKKLAAGLDGLVLDVKVGSGAFMKSLEDAQALADSLVNTANGAGCRTTALITDMNQSLVPSAGNALEVAEVMPVLTGDLAQGMLWELTCDLGGELLAQNGLAESAEAGADAIAASFTSGKAAEIFGRMLAALGGPADFVERWAGLLPEAPVMREVLPQRAGFVSAIDTHAVGLAVVALGGGRLKDTDKVDPSVGYSRMAGLGAPVGSDRPLGMIHAASERAADAAEVALRSAVTVSEAPPQVPPLLHERVTG